MTESGGRRIKRAFLIENDSVTACTDEKLEAYADLPYMKDYIAAKKKQREEGRVENTHNSEGLANGTIDTNLGLFRAYVNMYLLHHQSITSQFEVMARLLEPTEMVRLLKYTVLQRLRRGSTSSRYKAKSSSIFSLRPLVSTCVFTRMLRAMIMCCRPKFRREGRFRHKKKGHNGNASA